MPKFVIERDIPGAGKLTPAELQGISQKSCGVLGKMGPQIQWVQSYVTDDRIQGRYSRRTRKWTCGGMRARGEQCARDEHFRSPGQPSARPQAANRAW
ncbi:MAG TPA: DUF4242 domain-containing protein [Gemmatimonadaceae bacterium]|nr:DUF4242 domain-containing protein [Gemmatimonadaceae bacterium]